MFNRDSNPNKKRNEGPVPMPVEIHAEMPEKVTRESHPHMFEGYHYQTGLLPIEQTGNLGMVVRDMEIKGWEVCYCYMGMAQLSPVAPQPVPVNVILFRKPAAVAMEDLEKGRQAIEEASKQANEGEVRI